MDIETVAELEVEVSEIGEKGYSAYEVAVQNGFIGTETEWLASLKGADGIDGHDGRDGQDGENGTNGQDGITPTIGDNGNWYLGETDTGKPSRGIQGIQGVAGQDGNDGEDGVSPTVSISKSGKVTTISITDKNGVHTATINDGEDGQDGVTMAQVEAITGDLADLDTTDKTKLVSAINEVAGASGGDIGIEVLNLSSNIPNYDASNDVQTNLNASECEVVGNLINKFYNKGEASGILVIKSTNSTKSTILFSRSNNLLNVQNTRYNFLGFMTGWDSNTLRLGYSLIINGTWNNNVFSCSNATVRSGRLYLLNQFLTTNNTNSYTPTQDYNPASKKYVDDSIASAITNTLGGSY